MEQKIVMRKSRNIVDIYSRFIKPIGLILVLLSIPLTVYVLNQVQDIRQRAAGEMTPITTNFPQTGCPVAFTDIAPASYKTAVSCLNQTYCVTQGFDQPSTPNGLTFPSFGGDLPTTRRYAIAFIAHYRNNAVPSGDSRHWDYAGTAATGNVFKDVPAGSGLGLEIETAARYGFISGQDCGSLYTDGELSQMKAQASDKCFDPDGNWGFGFNDSYINSSGPGQKLASRVYTRGEFIQAVYDYGIANGHQDLQKCLVPPAAIPTATAVPTKIPPVTAACGTSCTSSTQCSQAIGGCTECKMGASAPQTDISKITGCAIPGFSRQFIDTAGKPYQIPVECLNKAYCVTVGFDIETCQKAGICPAYTEGQGYFGGEINTSRKFAIAFIARYRADVIPTGDPRHWNWVNPTTAVFADVPGGDLAREIATAKQYGFISGQQCSSVYSAAELNNLKIAGGDTCFDPEGDWLFGFNDSFVNTNTSTRTAGTPIKRGAFIKQLYDFGTSAAHPDLQKCMAPTTSGSCQQPAACNATCTQNADCAGAKDGCTTCGAGGKCTPPPAACGSGCKTNSDCSTASNGCTACNTETGKCSIPFNAGACHCDGIDASAIGSGQAVTFSAYSKVEGADTLLAMVKGVNIRVFRGGAEVANQIAQSGFLSPLVIESSAAKVRYKTDWKYTVPADANNGDLFRVQADMQCAPKTIAVVPAVAEKSLITRIVDTVVEPIRAVLGTSTTPTPTPPTALQISSFYPGEITDRKSCYLQFQIKK